MDPKVPTALEKEIIQGIQDILAAHNVELRIHKTGVTQLEFYLNSRAGRYHDVGLVHRSSDGSIRPFSPWTTTSQNIDSTFDSTCKKAVHALNTLLLKHKYTMGEVSNHMDSELTKVRQLALYPTDQEVKFWDPNTFCALDVRELNAPAAPKTKQVLVFRKGAVLPKCETRIVHPPSCFTLKKQKQIRQILGKGIFDLTFEKECGFFALEIPYAEDESIIDARAEEIFNQLGHIGVYCENLEVDSHTIQSNLRPCHPQPKPPSQTPEMI